jgi:hypothetical protein
MKKPNIYAKHALLEMHATLAGEMKTSNEHYFKLARQMREIEAVLKMMDPAFKISRIAVRRMQPSGWFKRGTVMRLCLDILRRENRPLTVREIMDRAFLSKGINPDAEKIGKVRSVFSNALRSQKGKTVQTIAEGPTVRWALAKRDGD